MSSIRKAEFGLGEKILNHHGSNKSKLLNWVKSPAAVRGNYETGNQVFSMRLRFLTIRHRQCRLIWLILHQGVRYEERGPAVTKESKQRRTWKMIRRIFLP